MRGKLHLYTDWEMGIHYAVRWIRKEARHSLSNEKRTVILLPNSATVNQLRRIFASRRISFLNICLWTPSDFRKRMLNKLPERPLIANLAEILLFLSSSISLAENIVTRREDIEIVNEWSRFIET